MGRVGGWVSERAGGRAGGQVVVGGRVRCYGGAHGRTDACQAAGITSDEPTELFADPDRRTGRRPEHDVLDPAVARRHLDVAAAPPGPGMPNVYQIAPL